MDTRLKNALFLQDLMHQLGALDERVRHILVFRVLAKNKKTLDDIGNALGLTRERVRQIEAKIDTDMAEQFLELRGIYQHELEKQPTPEAFVSMLGNLAPFGTRAQEHLAPGIIDFAWLGVKFGLYELDAGICFYPSKHDVYSCLRIQASRIRESGLFSLDEIDWDECTLGPVANFFKERALGILGFQKLSSGHWIESKNYLEAAAGLLELENGQTTLLALRDKIDPAISIKSFRQRLLSDDRFSLPDSQHVRLRAPNEELIRPESIQALIGEIVPSDGTKVPFAKVLEFVQSRRTAAESSVRAYASRYPFAVEQNMVLRSLSAVRRPGQHPSSTRNLFRLPDGWSYRLEVNSEHLRGSSVTIPAAFVNAFNLDIGPGLSFEDKATGGYLWMRWDGSQPKIRSIRQNLKNIGAQEGDWVLLTFSGNQFSVSRIQTNGLSGVDALERMFPNMYGIPREQFLYLALMCAELGGVPLLEAMKIRNEYDLIELFEGY